MNSRTLARRQGRKPINILKLENACRPARHADGGSQRRELTPVPKALSRCPPIPKCLSKTGKEFYRDLARRAITLGTLTGPDVGILLLAARTAERMETAQATLDVSGLTQVSGTGRESIHPLVPAIAAMTKLLRQFETDLGLTPASRASPTR